MESKKVFLREFSDISETVKKHVNSYVETVNEALKLSLESINALPIGEENIKEIRHILMDSKDSVNDAINAFYDFYESEFSNEDHLERTLENILDENEEHLRKDREEEEMSSFYEEMDRLSDLYYLTNNEYYLEEMNKLMRNNFKFDRLKLCGV